MAVESDSVQPVPHLRQEIFRMMALAADKLRCLGASVDSVDTGFQQVGWPLPHHERGHLPGRQPWLPVGVARLELASMLQKNAPIIFIPSKDEELHLVPDEMVLLISRCVRTGKAPLRILFTSFTCGSSYSQTILSLTFKCTFLKGPGLASELRLITASQSQMAILHLSAVAPASALMNP